MIVTIHDDFDLQKIMNSGQCFRCKIHNAAYRFITGNHVIYIKQSSDFKYDISCTIDEWENIWMQYFDLARNYKEIHKTKVSDDFMLKAVNAGAGIRILRQDPWETLISFIISQRKSIPAIKKCIESLSYTLGEKICTEQEELFAFPTAQSLFSCGYDALSSHGLGYRTPYVYDTAYQIHNNHMLLDSWFSLDDTALFTQLKALKGVGDKVANCVMLYAYGRTSRVPIDTWINRIITNEYNGRNPFPKYGAYAGIMQQYVFYYVQNDKQKVR